MNRQLKCQMTVQDMENTVTESYRKCNSPAKFRVPNPKMNVEYVCGIHARSLDKMFERTGQKIRCIPIDFL